MNNQLVIQKFSIFLFIYAAHFVVNGIVLGDFLRSVIRRKEKELNPVAVLLLVGVAIALFIAGTEVVIVANSWVWGKQFVIWIDEYFEITFWYRYRFGDGFNNLHPEYVEHIKTIYVAAITEISKEEIVIKHAQRTSYLTALVLRRNNVNIDEIKPEARYHEKAPGEPTK